MTTPTTTASQLAETFALASAAIVRAVASAERVTQAKAAYEAACAACTRPARYAM